MVFSNIDSIKISLKGWATFLHAHELFYRGKRHITKEKTENKVENSSDEPAKLGTVLPAQCFRDFVKSKIELLIKEQT